MDGRWKGRKEVMLLTSQGIWTLGSIHIVMFFLVTSNCFL